VNVSVFVCIPLACVHFRITRNYIVADIDRENDSDYRKW